MAAVSLGTCRAVSMTSMHGSVRSCTAAGLTATMEMIWASALRSLPAAIPVTAFRIM